MSFLIKSMTKAKTLTTLRSPGADPEIKIDNGLFEILIGTVQCTCTRIRHIWNGKQVVGLHNWDRV